MTLPSSLALLPTLARRRRAEGGVGWLRKHRAHALCYSMSPLPGLIQTVQNPIQNQIQTKIQTKTKTKTKTKFKPNSNPIQTIQTKIQTKIQTQFKPFEPQLKIHISSHAACNAKSGSNSGCYRHDELNNQLPSVLFRFCTHRL